jgi:DNA helicase-2/ATP-dependent DNA helicase PcrA
MRVFYVALSRAENLLILPQYTKAKAAIEEFKELIGNSAFKEIKDFKLRELDIAKRHDKKVTEVYSYTSDYLLYKRCPRHYMFLREYEFAGSRTQTMMFGNLVHQTIEDLHQLLIDQRSKETRSLNYDR